MIKKIVNSINGSGYFFFLFICNLSIFSIKHTVYVGDFLQGQMLILLTL